MKRNLSLWGFFLVSLIALSIGSTLEFGSAQTYKEVSGIIRSDTTWTKANSPYYFRGPVGISEGVTLTIEAGVTINGGYLQVNGTLIAKGSNAEPIVFNGGPIDFMSTSSGNTIERIIINSGQFAIKCNNVSPMINNNTIQGEIRVNASSPTISNNLIIGKISVEEGSPLIQNNYIITSSFAIECSGGSPKISYNRVTGNGVGVSDYTGIFGGGGQISNNVISGFQTGVKAGKIIEGNLISNNYFGIEVEYFQTIRHNTIMNNNEGLYVGESVSIIEFNNFQNNTRNIYLNTYATRNITAANNWWGTTDTQLIDEKIHNNWKNFDFITVNYTPFLTTPDSIAPEIPDDLEAIATIAPSRTPFDQNPTSTPSQPVFGGSVLLGLDWIGIAIVALLATVVVLLVFVVFYLRKRSIGGSVKKVTTV
ncbi:MAG: hypothetical protein NWE96_04710 [Candidatus Bathyarchaeota archaeon]|nr:hypothetical protein [Candidatus Bathyarchaeota archaeon]